MQQCFPKIRHVENTSLGKMQQKNIKTKTKTTDCSHYEAQKRQGKSQEQLLVIFDFILDHFKDRVFSHIIKIQCLDEYDPSEEINKPQAF